MKSIKSHLQPRHYLKGFLAAKTDTDHDDYLFVYKKGMPHRSDGTRQENNPVKSGPGNTAFVRNFYAFLNENGVLDAETYEQKLEREIERPGNAVLDKLRAVRISKNEAFNISEIIDHADRKVFARYVAGMAARTKKTRGLFENAVRSTNQKIKDQPFTYRSVVSHLTAEDKAALHRQTQKTDPEFNDSTAVRLPENYLKNYERETLENESFLQTMFGLIDEFAQIILRMKWQLRVTQPDRIFTGDAPVWWSDLTEPGANLLFPVSSRAIFCATLNRTILETVFFEHRKEFISIVRDVFARHCTELYCSDHQRWLVDFFNKR